MNIVNWKYIGLLLLCLCSGCVTPDVSYHYDPSKIDLECHGSCKSSDGYHLGIVEFDDQGYYHNRLQRDEVFNWLKSLLGPDEDAIILSYTHGWFHNANESEEGNLQEFRRVLSNLVKQEQALTESINAKRIKGLDRATARKVIGIYTGWRGESLNTRGIKLASFWERKKIAQLIGARDGKDYFSSLSAIKANNGGKDTRLVILGHSFGGLLVHSATTGLVIDRFNQSIEGDNVIVSGLGDLIVLVNPAFEALDIGNLTQKANTRNYDTQQRPLYIVLSSEKDKATNLPFRFGRFFTTFFDNYRNDLKSDWGTAIERQQADKTALGHYEKFRTHILEPLEITDDVTKIGWLSNGADPNSPLFENLCRMWRDWQDPNNDSLRIDPGTGDFFQLKHIAGKKQSPFLFVSVDETILPGHSIDDAEKLLSFVGQMVVFRAASNESLSQCSDSLFPILPIQ